MSVARQHGRRRATPIKSSPALPGRHWVPGLEPARRGGKGRKQLGIVAVAAAIALTALPVAHAESHRLAPAVTVGASVPSATLQQDVTADKDVEVSFAKPKVFSKPAPPASPASAVQPAAAEQSSLPAPAPTPAPAAVDQVPVVQTLSGLRPPLAALTVTSPFGYRTNPLTGAAAELHTGTDFAGSCGTAVFAAGAGTVTEAGWSQYGGGNRIVVDHGGGIKTTYNHLDSIAVSVGQQVGAGAQIAGVGTTGNSTGCHLHFEVMQNGQTIDPAPFI
ncbi:M23 family metallopeptidase [Arthrobacter sp. H35-D1]|uniref:M23 family metallopeptidase n=1 Tax=Arthrobacter sp. H35-D1 TaxID=3046202 RepID=UPI0024BAF68A|nr:M23 family metallopeptidase [Arthrobacter sp. H35-D1]MDJ0313172.1 M23 family metallopeptidase [Arthrobacter sp. H35-D1]